MIEALESSAKYSVWSTMAVFSMKVMGRRTHITKKHRLFALKANQAMLHVLVDARDLGSHTCPTSQKHVHQSDIGEHDQCEPFACCRAMTMRADPLMQCVLEGKHGYLPYRCLICVM